MRLIDADALKEEAMYLSLGIDDDVEAVTVRDIDNASTVYSIKHAHWIDSQGKFSACSNCGVVNNDSVNRTKYFMPYCFRCGARMDEEVNE